MEDAETEDAGNTNDKVFIQDTQKIFAGSGLPSAQKQIGLQNALRALDIPCRKLHNAGNDAHCELQPTPFRSSIAFWQTPPDALT